MSSKFRNNIFTIFIINIFDRVISVNCGSIQKISCQLCSSFCKPHLTSRKLKKTEIKTNIGSKGEIPGLYPSAEEKKNTDANLPPLNRKYSETMDYKNINVDHELENEPEDEPEDEPKEELVCTDYKITGFYKKCFHPTSKVKNLKTI